jgi:excisionase family DNA binding protein
MTDELGTGHREVTGNLFDLDEVPDSSAHPAGTAKGAAAGKAKTPAGRADAGPAPQQPPRKPTVGTGPVLLLSVEEAARSLSIGRSKMFQLIAAGQLEAVHIGRSTRVAVSALHDLLERLPRAAEG